MDQNYHIYEQIGAGKRTTVYKARRKRTLEYVAIRRNAKHHLPEVQQQVSLLHSVVHSNVLRFHAWYTTPRHVYAAVEYCAGGSLDNVIAQDGGMPEAAARFFGRDLLCG